MKKSNILFKRTRLKRISSETDPGWTYDPPSGLRFGGLGDGNGVQRGQVVCVREQLLLIAARQGERGLSDHVFTWTGALVHVSGSACDPVGLQGAPPTSRHLPGRRTTRQAVASQREDGEGCQQHDRHDGQSDEEEEGCRKWERVKI